MGGKDGRRVGLTKLPPSYNDYRESLGASASWNPNVTNTVDQRSRNSNKKTQLYLYIQ